MSRSHHNGCICRDFEIARAEYELGGPVQGGDTAVFLAAFLGGADANAEGDAIEFISTVTDRYGELVASSQRDDGREVSTLRRAVILYEFQFETGPVDAEAEFVLSREDGSGLVLKFAWVVIRDPAAGDVGYPSLSAP